MLIAMPPVCHVPLMNLPRVSLVRDRTTFIMANVWLHVQQVPSSNQVEMKSNNASNVTAIVKTVKIQKRNVLSASHLLLKPSTIKYVIQIIVLCRIVSIVSIRARHVQNVRIVRF